MRSRLVLSSCLLFVALFIHGCGGKGYSGSNVSTPTAPSTGTGTTGAAGVTVTIPAADPNYATDASFTPGQVTVPQGSTVTWQNKDATAHTTTSTTGLWNGALPAGASFAFTFNNKGTFAYTCTLHAGMTGAITVQ